MRKFFFLSIIFTYFVNVVFTQTPVNLLKNGDFETENQGFIEMWYTDAYDKSAEAVRFFLYDTDKYAGAKCLGIANLRANDSRLLQWVDVKPDTCYKIAGRIKALNVTGGEIGANISIIGTTKLAASFLDTKNVWEPVEFYGITGHEQTQLGVMARLGFFGNLVMGYAFFDDFSLVEVSDPPVDIVLDFSTDTYVKTNAVQKPESTNSLQVVEEKQGTIPMGWLMLISVFIALMLFCGITLLLFYVNPDLFRKIFDKMSLIIPLKLTNTERRVADRRRIKLPVVVIRKTRSGAVVESHLNSRNVSLTGIFVITEELGVFDLEENVFLHIVLGPKRILETKARVVRSEVTYYKKKIKQINGYGLQFVDLPVEAYNKLIFFLDNKEPVVVRTAKSAKK